MRYALFVVLLAGCASAQNCDVPDLVTGSTQGTLAASDCALSAFLPGVPAELRADAWRLRVSENTVYTIKLSSTAFDALLYILNSNRRLVARDNNSGGGKDAEIFIQLPAGVYTVVATSSGAGAGDYTLEARSEPPRPCHLQPLPLDTEVERDLSDADCRYADLYIGYSDRNYVDVSRIDIEQFTIFDVRMSSTALDAYLALTNDEGEEIASDDDGAGGTDARLYVSLKPGRYYLEASSSVPGTGVYRLLAKLEQPRSCTPVELTPGSSASGRLSEEDCRILDLLDSSTDTTLIDLYPVEMKEAGVLKAGMKSAEFDTYLALLDAQRDFLGGNDDIEDGVTDSELMISLRPGVYTLVALAFEESTGAYEVSLAREPLRECAAERLAVPGAISGSFVAGGCRRLDAAPPSMDPRPAAVFSLPVTARSVVSLDLAAATQPVLELRAGDEVVGFARRGGPTSTLLLPGSYPVVVTAADNRLGEFTITAGTAEPKSCPEAPLEIGAAVEGELRASDCAAADVIAAHPYAEPRVNLYKIEIAEAGPVTLTLTSRAFPPALYILDAGYATVERNENENLSTSIRTRWNASPGVHYIAVSDLLGLVGAYTISVTR